MLPFQYSSIYQIYLKSFQDSNNDGIGDLRGITQRLDYIKALGVSYIWITPFFTSPQQDNGYDVADYCAIDPMYGTMEDFEHLVQQASLLNIGIMLDMVFNHTSTHHPWFQRALDGDPTYRDYYIWHNPMSDGSPPTNWESKFGGSAWEYVPALNQYYLHLFDVTQADLNWEDPALRQELRQVLRFWMNKGVKGFRFDVINLISKPTVFENDALGNGKRMYTDGHNVHEYLKELCAELHAAQILTVGEMSSTTIEHCVKYSHPDQHELSMCFHFHHLKVDYKDQQKWCLQKPDFMALRNLLHEWQLGIQRGGGWSALFWSNHDQPRILSRFGDPKHYPTESGKMLAAVLYLMRGTPYIYQGEEIGMTNAGFTDLTQYRDVESINYFKILRGQGIEPGEILEILRQRSRDNARTPMQWDDSPHAGFTAGTPWLQVNPHHQAIHVKRLQHDSSILAWYQTLIALRKQKDAIALGSYQPLLQTHDKVIAYQRDYHTQHIIVIANFFGEQTEITLDLPNLQQYHCILRNYAQRPLQKIMQLQPYETLILEYERNRTSERNITS